MIELKIDMPDDQKLPAETLIYLVSCAVNGEAPEQDKFKKIDLRKLYQLAKRHSLSAVCCMALEQTDVFSQCHEQLVKNWMEEKNKAIRKTVMLDAERSKICAYMEQAGIWYMPLKGIILKDYYPKLGMREMADNDILYDAAYQKQLKSYMKSQHYEVESIGKGNHDVYMKDPVYNYEMHTALYGKGHPQGWDLYYNDVKKRLLPDPDCSYGFHFQEEDFYIYVISHAYKHYQSSGTGLRTLVDSYVYLKQKEEQLNWQYIEKELDRLQLSEFEQETRQLCKKVFSMEKVELSVGQTKQLAYYLGSGTYGTMKNNVTNELRKVQSGQAQITHATRRRYFLRRLFPDMNYYQQFAPFVYRHKWLIPGFLVYRIMRAVIRNGKGIRREIQIVKKIDK